MIKRIFCILLIITTFASLFSINTFAINNDKFSMNDIKFVDSSNNTHAYTIAAKKNIRATANVKRNAVGSGDVCLALCLYDSTNKMLGMVKGESVNLKKDETVSMSVEYTLPGGVNGQANYLRLYCLDVDDGISIYSCDDERSARLPRDLSGQEETVHLTVHDEKRQTLKGVGTSYTESHRVGGGLDRNLAGYNLLHSEEGTNFNVLRLWVEMTPPCAEYDKKTGKVKLLDGMKTFKGAYIDSGLISELEKITNNDLKIILTPSTLLPGDMRENAAQNVILDANDAVQRRNVTLKENKLENIKNSGSVLFKGIDVPNQYTSLKMTVGSKLGGTVYLINADKNSVLASMPVEPTGGDDVMKEISYSKKISMNGVKNIKLKFEANGDEFGSFSNMQIDGNTIIKTSQIPACADLMAGFVDALEKDHNVDVDYLTMFNEPLFHFTPEQLRMMVKEMRKTLDKRGLDDVKILADEWAEIDEFTLYSWQKLVEDKEALDAIDGLSFHSYKTHGLDYFEKVKGIFEAAGKEIWMTESSDTEVLNTIKNGDYIQGAEQIAKMLNDFNNNVEYWVHFFGVGWGSVGGGNNATSIVGVSKDEEDWLTTNGCYKYYKHIMDSFDYGCTFRYCTTTEYGDMARPRGKKPPINAAFAQNEDGSYTLALVNSSQERYMAEGWANQNNNPYAITENIEIYIEELAGIPEVVFDVHRSGPDGICINEESISAKNGKLSVTVDDSELLTLRSK